MDQELITFFNERFRHMDERFDHMDERFRETSRQIESVREDTAQQIAMLREETTHRFEQIEDRLDKMDGRLDKVEETGRQSQVLIEGLRDELHLVAEWCMGSEERQQAFRGEVALGFKDVKDSIAPYYKNLNDRVLVLDDRVRILESRASRQHEDVIAAIRRSLGREPAA